MLHNDKTIDLDRITSGQLFRQQDSSSRYWFFRTDTTFYFHPDSGLFAKGGRLWLQEFWRGENVGLRIYDSLDYRVHENQQIAQKSFSERITKGYYWGVVIAVIILVVLGRLFA